MAALVTGSLGLASPLFADADNPHLRRHDNPSGAKKEPATAMSEKDQKFVVRAVSTGEQEIQDGMIAEKKAKSSEARKVANRVVSDHQTANKQLTEMAKKKGLGVTTGNIKPRDMGTKNYDAQYLYSIETDNQQDIKDFEKEARTGDDSQIKAWAAKTLPMLKAHRAMAKKARKELK